MAENANAYKVRSRPARKVHSKTGKNPREKVTGVALPRAVPPETNQLEPAPEWSAADITSEAEVLNYVPPARLGEVPLPPPAPRAGFEAALVNALVSLAKFTRRKPATALAIAAIAGLLAGTGIRRI
jgi:hypothetical protein